MDEKLLLGHLLDISSEAQVGQGAEEARLLASCPSINKSMGSEGRRISYHVSENSCCYQDEPYRPSKRYEIHLESQKLNDVLEVLVHNLFGRRYAAKLDHQKALRIHCQLLNHPLHQSSKLGRLLCSLSPLHSAL